MVAEQLQRLAGIQWAGEVQAVATDQTRDGLGWRTRMRYQVDDHGRAGLRAHRSQPNHSRCPTGAARSPTARTPAVADQSWPPGAELVAVAAADGPALLVDGQRRVGQGVLHEQAAARDWAVAVDGFWQVHPAAADTLVGAVLSGVEPQPGERALDLYCGVGLFAGALADAGCRVWGVEGSRAAVQQARRNLADVAARVTLTRGAGGAEPGRASAAGRRGRAGPAAGRRRGGGDASARHAYAAGHRLCRLRSGRVGP